MADSLKDPYLRDADRRGNIHVWIVDRIYVRGYIDEEFTSFGQHYRYPSTQDHEFWIDEEAEHDEQAFLTDHLIVERQLMAKRMPYEKALIEADRVERKERRRAGDLAKATDRGQQPSDGSVAYEHLWKTLENGASVRIINGRFLRSFFDIDFTAGGHDRVYEFVPEGEVRIDDASTERERQFVLLHELDERNRMAEAVPYSQTHAESCRMEFHCRYPSDELHAAIAAEGWV